MSDERIEELAALHAFDLLEGEERAAFERQLAGDPGLQRLLRELRESAAALALAAPAVVPDPALRTRVLQQIDDRPLTNPKSKLQNPKSVPAPFRLGSLVPWAIAAGFAVAAAWLGQSLLSLREEAAADRTEARLAQLVLRDANTRLQAERIVLNRQVENSGRQFTDAQQQLAAASAAAADATRRVAELTQQLKTEGDVAQLKISTLASMLGNSPQALAVAVWNPARQEGVFTVEKMPPAAADQDYELWLIEDRPAAKPVSGGVFTPGPDGSVQVRFKPEAPVARAAKFAISREKKGGAPRLAGPQGDVIMISR
ncbi:MAG TPA: anti-sigma factor [Opitutaceae bacterium]|nr:anti-sigma factor [Opitutaceae bacterium]